MVKYRINKEYYTNDTISLNCLAQEMASITVRYRQRF